MAINRDRVLETAQKFVDKKKYDKAVEELRKLVQQDQNDARTLLKIGDLEVKQAKYPEAISTYERVGKLYAQQGFALKAIAVYKQIREIIAKHVPHEEEKYGHITPRLADLYQQLGLTSDALAALDEVATRLQRQQRDQEAIDVFRKIVELDPINPITHLRLAEALSRVRDVPGAVAEFKTAASQLAGIGRRDDAIKVLERLLHHLPDHEQARICAELYLARGQPQDGMLALAKLQLCFQANPRDIDTLSLLARAFNAIGQGAKAIEVQKEMARVARDSGRQDLFREIVERLLRVAPTDDGVRKLASQSSAGGSAAPPPAQQPAGQYGAAPYGLKPPPYGGPAPYGAGQPAYGAPEPQYGAPHAPPYAAPQPYAPSAPEPPPEVAYARGARRFAIPDGGVATHDISEEELDELSYEEVHADEIQDEARGAHEEQAPAYGEPEAYGEDAAQAYAEHGYEGQPAGAHAEEADVAERLQKVLEDATSFRRVRLYGRALETLRGGLELDPRSMDLHEIYRDVLIEAGHTEDAVQEMLVIASLYVDALDGDSAARALQDVLAFDPQNARAIEMLQELGYEIVDENEQPIEGGEEGRTDVGGRAYAEEEPAQDRLPSYDVEEMRPQDVSAEYEDDRQVRVGPSQAPDAYDDGALPSFPLDEEGAEAYEIDGDAEQPAAAAAHAYEAAPVAASQAPAPTAELEDALDEAEFFCSRGLFEDARAILAEQLAAHPNHPLLRERMAEIDAQELQRGSGAREKPRPQDRAFDIAASLDALESLDYPEDAPQPGGFAEPDKQVDVEEVFAKFKEGVAKQISVDDSDSHYNLGIAYREMLLLDDAIHEFDVAAQDPKRECVCRSMIGMVEIERGRLNEAIEAFLQGLNAQIKDPQQETVLCYEIGAAYEAKKMLKDALSYFQKAMRRDPNYRDVQERVRRLAKNEPKAPIKAAVGADDEFDRAFDDLLGKA